MPLIGLTGTTGKLGGAVLQALLDYSLAPANGIVISTSSNPHDPKFDQLKRRGVVVRYANYDDKASLEKAFAGCGKLLLISSPQINLDFGDAEYGHGREKHHFNAIHAARAVGVRHIYYTSLGFEKNAKAAVMKAHMRTEDFLHMLTDTSYTIIREGIYNESWPLYFGHYNGKEDNRQEIVVAGNGPISWASIPDLGLATAMILVDNPAKYNGRTVTLASTTHASLEDVARAVSRVKERNIMLRKVPKDEYEKYYQERGMDKAYVEWWATTYDSLNQGQAAHRDNLMAELLSTRGRKPKPLFDTITEMLS